MIRAVASRMPGPEGGDSPTGPAPMMVMSRMSVSSRSMSCDGRSVRASPSSALSARSTRGGDAGEARACRAACSAEPRSCAGAARGRGTSPASSVSNATTNSWSSRPKRVGRVGCRWSGTRGRPDVLLHDPPALVGGQRVPGARLHERVDEQVLAAERRAGPRRCSSEYSDPLRIAEERVRAVAPTSSARSGRARRGTRGCGRGSRPRRRASGRRRRACRPARSAQQVVGARSPRRRRGTRACPRRARRRAQPPPRGIDLQEGVLDEVALGHGFSKNSGWALLRARRRAARWRPRSARRRGAAPPLATRSACCSPSCRATSARPTSTCSKPSILERLDPARAVARARSAPTQGGYDQTQALLDISAGTRISPTRLRAQAAAGIALVRQARRRLHRGLVRRARRRRDARPADIVPGLLALDDPGRAGLRRASIGRAARGGRGGEPGRARSRACRSARPATSSRARSAAERSAASSSSALPTRRRRRAGARRAARPRAARRADRSSCATPPQARAPRCCPSGMLGPRRPATLTSRPRRGARASSPAIDIPPTVLDHLGAAGARGDEGPADRGRGQARRRGARWRSTTGCASSAARRLAGARGGAARRGWGSLLVLGHRRPAAAALRAALRVGALAVLWLPRVLLVTAALRADRGRGARVAGRLGVVALAALTDRFVPLAARPDAPGARRRSSPTPSTSPAAPTSSSARCWARTRASARASTGSATSSRRSLPRAAARRPGRAARLRAALAQAAAAFALAGSILGAAIGSGRLGADVGGVITVGAGLRGRDAGHAAGRRHGGAVADRVRSCPSLGARARWRRSTSPPAATRTSPARCSRARHRASSSTSSSAATSSRSTR